MTSRFAVVMVMAGMVAASGCGSSEKQAQATGQVKNQAPLLDNRALPAPPEQRAGADVAKAQRMLVDHAGQPEFAAPGPPLDIRKAKPVWLITAPTTFPDIAEVGKAFTEAAKVAGVASHVCPGMSTPQGNALCIKQAIAQGAGSVILFSQNPTTVAEPIRQAHEAGLKVVSGNNALRIGEANPRGIDAQVSHDYYGAGALNAAYAVASRGAALDSLCIAVAEYTVTGAVCKGYKETVTKLCPDCKVTVKDVSVAQLPQDTDAIVNQEVLQNRHLNYIVGSIDDLGPLIFVTLKRLGKSPDDVFFSSQNGNVHALSALRDPKSYQMMTAGQNTDWWGWAFFDAGARVQLQPMTKAVVTAPNELFTRQGFKYDGPIDYSHVNEAYGFGASGDVYKDAYRTLWKR